MIIFRELQQHFQKTIQTIYDWMILLASRPHALLFLAIVSFAESSFFPIPPDIMLIPMVLAMPKKAWQIAGIATVSSVLGGFLGYGIGLFLYDSIAAPILKFYGYLHQFESFQEYYHQWGAWIVFGAGITPFPYKVITIASGVVHLNVLTFAVASVLARGLRFYLVAGLLKFYGKPMKMFIEKNLNFLSIVFVVLLLSGFIALKYLG